MDLFSKGSTTLSDFLNDSVKSVQSDQPDHQHGCTLAMLFRDDPASPTDQPAVFAEEGFDETLRDPQATPRRPDHPWSSVAVAPAWSGCWRAGPTSRDTLLDQLAIGLRTYYRELDLLKRCGIKVKRDGKTYHLSSTIPEAEERLPFPDPQLSFAEMAELAAHPGAASKRLAAILKSVVDSPSPTPKEGRRAKSDS